jgi:copper(I)-binding protein
MKRSTHPEYWFNAVLLVVFALLIGILVSACGENVESKQSGKATVAPVIETHYARAVPPGTPASAAFMLIKNSSDDERKLVKASSPVAAVVELHTHTMKDGMMQMRQVDSIAIPAQGQTELKPGSFHIMLIQLQQALVVGENIKVSVEFDDGSTQELDVPVKDIQPMMHGKAH